MKIDPNGSKPPITTIANGFWNHTFVGIGLGIWFTLHGQSGAPYVWRPTMVPSSVSGTETSAQIRKTTTILCKRMVVSASTGQG